MTFPTKSTLALVLPVLLLTLSACTAPSAPSDGDEIVASDEEELSASSHLRSSRSIKTLLDAIAVAKTNGQWQPPLSGTHLHACRTQGIRGRVTFDIYIDEHLIEDSPGVVLVKAKGVSFAVPAKINLGKDSGTTYLNDDVAVDLLGVSFGIDVSDTENYASFTAAFFDNVPLVCTLAPAGWSAAG